MDGGRQVAAKKQGSQSCRGGTPPFVTHWGDGAEVLVDIVFPFFKLCPGQQVRIALRDGKPLERRNLLRHVKRAARDLGLPKRLDFRSFRTMHSSLMRREGVRLEVVRDNMGHSEIATTANIYSKS
jgi:integrase